MDRPTRRPLFQSPDWLSVSSPTMDSRENLTSFGATARPSLSPIRPGFRTPVNTFRTPVNTFRTPAPVNLLRTPLNTFRPPGPFNLLRTPVGSDPFRTPAPVNSCRTPASMTSYRTPVNYASSSSSSSGHGGQRRQFSFGPGSSVSTPSSSRSSRSETGSTTPSSAYTAHQVEPLDPNTVMAIVEGRGHSRGEVGIACLNLHTPNIILSQFSDTQSYLKVISKVNVFRPGEILMSSTACDMSSPTQLFEQLRREIPNVKVVPIQRRLFNEVKGHERLTSIVTDEFTSIVHSVTSKYYCSAAFAALLKYVELVHSVVFASKSMRLEFQGPDQSCLIDHVTAQHLELLVNNRNPTSGHSLFGILNDCKTPLGARLLRMNILQPPCEEKIINTRLNSVEELMRNRETMFRIQDILSRLPIDIEHVIASLIQIPKISTTKTTEYRINYIIALKHTLELLPGLVGILENCADPHMRMLKTNLMSPQFAVMLEKIKEVINEEAQYQKGPVNMKHQRCFAVKADVNAILDVARRAYVDIIEDMNNYVVELSEHMNMSLRLANTNQRGYYIQFFTPARTLDPPSLPPQFLQVRKRGNSVTFTTEVLISSDHRAQEVLKEIENLSGIVIAELVTSLRGDISELFKVSEAVGYLDLVYALANYALITPRCVRPKFSSDNTTIVMGRHPIIESISTEPIQPNNVALSKYLNFKVITGPNMSGKTTYIKQTAVLQVLAQIGSFIPADAACFRIASNILSRIGTGDCINENASSFQVEMGQMTYILQNVNNNSLVIIDELGRATSIEEGAAVCWAMSEELLKHDAFVLFATHHMFLTKLESLHLRCTNYKMVTQEWEGDSNPERSSSLLPSRLQFNHIIKRGVTEVENYGLKFAMNTSYPKPIIDKALPIVKAIMEERGQPSTSPIGTGIITDNRRERYMLGCHLVIAANSDMAETCSVDDIRNYLKSLQAEFRHLKVSKPEAANGQETRTQGVVQIELVNSQSSTDCSDDSDIISVVSDDAVSVVDSSGPGENGRQDNRNSEINEREEVHDDQHAN